MKTNNGVKKTFLSKVKSHFWKITCGVLLILFIALGVKSNYFNYILYRLNLKSEYVGGDYWAKRGWTTSLAKLNINADIVFFGNSITAGSSFHDSFPEKTIVNLGYPGDYLKGMLSRIEQVRCVHPKKIFLMGGINHIHTTSAKSFKEQYNALVDSLLTIVDSSNLYIQSILPVSKSHSIDNDLIIQRNVIIKNIAISKHCTYIDLHSLYYKNG